MGLYVCVVDSGYFDCRLFYVFINSSMILSDVVFNPWIRYMA